MPTLENAPQRNRILWAVGASIVFHLLALFVTHRADIKQIRVEQPIQASLMPSRKAPKAAQAEAPRPAPKQPVAHQRTEPRRRAGPRMLSVPRSDKVAGGEKQRWSVAEKADMDHFLDDLGKTAKQRQPPTLSQRAMAMAGTEGARLARQDQSGAAAFELRPNAAPPDQFSMEMYLNGVLRRLNQSAAYVRNDPRSRGVKVASVQFRIDPDGSLNAFSVLYAGDQAGEIEFIRSVVQRAVPFAPFPADINRSVRALTMKICILPAGLGGGGFGFTRSDEGRDC